jgi:hypothetical protein
LNNLIITIIGIALTAVAAAMAIFYGGTALSGSQAQILANTLISESQQLMTTNTEYMLDKGLGSFDDIGADAPAIANYTQGRIPILGMTTYAFDQIASYSQLDNGALGITTDSQSATIPSVAGQSLYVYRYNDMVSGVNAIVYDMSLGGPVDFAPAGMANNVIVEMCKDINAQMPPPVGTTYSDSGLPQMSTVTSSATGPSNPPNHSLGGWYVDSTRTTLNYCYIGSTGDTTRMYFVFSN